MLKPANPHHVAYRETIRRAAVGDRKYIRYFDGRGHFAHVRLELIPRKSQLTVISCANDLSIPQAFYHAARAALFDKLERGPLQHFPMIGLEARLLAVAYMDGYSDAEAFAHAASMSFDDALPRAEVIVIEPCIGVRLRVDQQVIGDTIAILTQLLGVVEANISLGDHFVIQAPIPVRLLGSIKTAFHLNCLDTFAIDPDQQYRPIAGAIDLRRQTDGLLDEWT